MILANNFFFYLLSLLPLIFITGPFLTDLSISLIGLYYILICFLNKDISIFKSKFFIFFIIFYFWLILSAFFSESYKQSLFSNDAVIFYFRYIFFIFGSAYLLKKNVEKLQTVILLILIAFMIVLFDSYLQFFTGFNILGYEKYEIHRLTSFFKDETIVGQYLVKIFPVLLILFLIQFPSNKYFILCYLILSSLVFIIVLLSGERLSFVLISSFLIAFLIYPKKKAHVYFFQLLFLIISFCFIYLSVDYVGFRLNQTLSQISETKFGFLPFTPEHEKHYFIAIKMFLDNPILGIGPAMFEELCKKDIYFFDGGCASHPHNFYIQLLAETGIVGLSFLSFAFIYLLIKVVKIIIFERLNDFSFVKYLIYSQIALLILPLVPHNDFYNNHLNFLVYYPIGIMIFINNQSAKSFKP